MKNLKQLGTAFLAVMCDLLVWTVSITAKGLLKLSKWLKRTLNVETPLYKWWWKEYSKRMQVRLDRAQRIRVNNQ